MDQSQIMPKINVCEHHSVESTPLFDVARHCAKMYLPKLKGIPVRRFFYSQSRQIPIVHIASQVAQVGQQIEPHETIKSTLHMVTFGAMWAMSFIHFYPVSQHIPANHGEFASGIGFLAPFRRVCGYSATQPWGCPKNG